MPDLRGLEYSSFQSLFAVRFRGGSVIFGKKAVACPDP
jgi:hypothetical protein